MDMWPPMCPYLCLLFDCSIALLECIMPLNCLVTTCQSSLQGDNQGGGLRPHLRVLVSKWFKPGGAGFVPSLLGAALGCQLHSRL
jgi:hypothetical protein